MTDLLEPVLLEPLLERLSILFISTFIGGVISWIAWSKGFYHLPKLAHIEKSVVTWKHVAWAFGLFLAVELFFVPAFYLLWLSLKKGVVVFPEELHIDKESQGWINILAIASVAMAFWVFYNCLSKECRREIWGRGHQGKGGRAANLLKGALTWFIAYPWIVVISQIIGIILQFSNKGAEIDQVAVRHVKDALAHPFLLWSTVVSVVIIVPILEEFLFRGFLQTWLKSRIGRVRAIILTSIIFAVFHFSSTQGIENVELITALFILSCYLGFAREKWQSLWASIGMHAMFNSISIAIILSSF